MVAIFALAYKRSYMILVPLWEAPQKNLKHHHQRPRQCAQTPQQASKPQSLPDVVKVCERRSILITRSRQRPPSDPLANSAWEAKV